MNELRVDLLKLDYADRQLIVVRPDEEVVQGRRRESAPPAAPVPATSTAGERALATATQVGSAIASWLPRRSERRKPLPITRDEARRLSLPAGHPLYDVVYVGNPVEPSLYYTLADFHRQTFLHKFNEALILLSSLGAGSMQVVAGQGWRRDFAANVGLAVPLTWVDANAERESQAVGSRALYYAADLPGSGDPRLPRERRWFDHEQEWQGFATQRMEYDLRDFTLQVRYEEDFSITTEVAAGVTKAGLKTGGSFQRHESTVWAISATFPPNQPRALRAIKHPFG